MPKLIVIGTSHIAKQSLEEIKQIIEQHRPDIIAIELDIRRFQVLLARKKTKIHLSDIRRVGIKGFLFALIGSYIQKKLGKAVGVAPGSDMLQAIRLAKQHNLPIALIDQDIEITLRRFSQALTWKERLRFAADLFKGVFLRKRELEKYGLSEIDLSKVPPEKLITKLTAQLKKRYPNIYQVLIAERNKVMIQRLRHLLEQNPNKTILAVVGAGHKEAILNAFKK